MESTSGYLETMSIRQLSIIMGFVTLFAPSFMGTTMSTRNGVVEYIEPVITAITWLYAAPYVNYYGGFQFMVPEHFFMYSIFTMPPILFAVFVIRYCQGKSTANQVWLSAILSYAISLLLGTLSIISFFMAHWIFVYDGLIPIQLIIGYLIVKHKESPLEGLHWENKEDTSKRENVLGE